MRKQLGMEPSAKPEALPEALQDRSEEVSGVKDGESDDHQVERVPHLLGGQDEAGGHVAEDAYV